MSKVIELKSPIVLNGTQVDKVELREPTVQDMLDMDKHKGSQAEKELSLIANLAQCAPDDLKKLAYRDYKQLMTGLEDFLS